jgi:N-acetylglucosamine kinase-like BadF-type ATPase
MLPAVLAVDAGNSKTDVALVAVDGQLLGSARGPGFAPHLMGAGPAVTQLGAIVARAAVGAGLPPEAVQVAEHVSACLANADFPVEQTGLEDAIAARGWGRTQAVFNDTHALLRAGLGDDGDVEGVAVVCGAGINCTGRLADGREARFAAVGQISGDWGGGGFLWAEAMWWAARDADGRGPRTALSRALPAHYGLPDMAALIEAVHLGGVPPSRCLEMTPLLFEVAAAGDAVAGEVVLRQAAEVVAIAVAALGRLDALGRPMPVLLGGGVLTAGHRLLLEEVERGLGREAPYAIVRVVAADPVLGAGLLGLDRRGVGPAAKQRLRASYQRARPTG